MRATEVANSEGGMLTLVEALANGTDETMILVNGDGVHAVRQGNPLRDELGLELSSVLEDLDAFISDEEIDELKGRWHAVASAPGMVQQATFVIRDARGEAVQLEGTAQNLEHTDMGGVLVRLRTARLSQLPPPPSSDSIYADDPLIQKPRFMELVQRAVDRKVRRVWRAPKHARSVARDRRCDYAVVLLNLDRYGVLRGSFGEDELQNLMRSAAHRLRRALRSRDAVAHLGASELAMYLDGVADAEQATRVTDAYMRILEDRFELDGESVSLAPIIGIATSERRYDRAEDLIRDALAAASAAMRRARSGRQAYQTGIRQEDRRRLILAADLRDGLKLGHVFEHYQPIVALQTGRLLGFEALCRWHHPTLAMVAPDEFIPVAEETGLIRKLGQRVLRNACAQTAAWNKTHAHPMTISVNVSAAEIVHETFASDVESALRDAGMAAEQLVLEVTESALLEDLGAAKENMSLLRERGVQFALDDFGTGYASLAYLVELPFNKLKIDRSLVDNDGDPHRRQVVRAVIALGHELGLDVVAEGIETPSQVRELEDAGCDLGQGYLYGAPMNVDEATELIEVDQPR